MGKIYSDYLKIDKPKIWDKKWRIVVFDIPEKQRGARDSLRTYLKKLDFYELQKSIFISAICLIASRHSLL